METRDGLEGKCNEALLGEGEGSHLEVVGPQLLEVGPQHLVGVHVDHLLDAEGKQHVQEEDLVPPDDALLLRLLGEPLRPLVGHICHLLVIMKLRNGGTSYISNHRVNGVFVE